MPKLVTAEPQHKTEQRVQTEALPEPASVVLVRLRSPAKPAHVEWRDELLHGLDLKPVRDALEWQGRVCEHKPSSALILVTPEDYDAALAAVQGIHLHSYNIILDTQFEPLLKQALMRLSYNKRPRERQCSRTPLQLEYAHKPELSYPATHGRPAWPYELTDTDVLKLAAMAQTLTEPLTEVHGGTLIEVRGSDKRKAPAPEQASYFSALPAWGPAWGPAWAPTPAIA